tara:strand:- start:286 stop:1272 length:987 start_codon:yes stop_codon:yes gene_type:complete
MKEYAFTLKSLLYPITEKNFFSCFLGQKLIYIRNNGNKFFNANFYDSSYLQDWLNCYYFDYPKDIEITQEGSVLPAGFLQPKSSHQLSSELIKKAFENGWSIVINNLERLSACTFHLSNSISKSLGLHVWVNLYSTPLKHRAFLKHTDTHDVLIFQITGSKKWTLFTNGENEIGNIPIDITLNEGDVLYLPEGMAHFAQANSASTHLTISFNRSECTKTHKSNHQRQLFDVKQKSVRSHTYRTLYHCNFSLEDTRLRKSGNHFISRIDKTKYKLSLDASKCLQAILTSKNNNFDRSIFNDVNEAHASSFINSMQINGLISPVSPTVGS